MNEIHIGSEQTIRNYEKRGMPVYRKGRSHPRYNLEEVKEWLRGSELMICEACGRFVPVGEFCLHCGEPVRK